MRAFFNLSTVTIILSFITVSSCTKTEYVEKEVIKTVTDTIVVGNGYSIDALNICIPTEGGTNTVSFSTKESWNASVINGRADGWLTFSPKNGDKGNGKVEVKASGNDASEERSATLRISSGKSFTDFYIVQKTAASLLATTSKYEIKQQGGDFSVEIKSDVEYSWEIESDAMQWIQEKSSTKAVSSKTIYFQVASNSGDRREGRIIFRAGSLKEVVSVYQEGQHSTTEHIVLSNKDCQISSDGGSIKVELSSQYDVSMRIPEGYDWIKEGNSQSTNTFYLQIEPNLDADSREGFVSFTDKNGGFSENVNILQLQKDAIALAKNSYMFGNEGGTLNIEVLANNPVEVSIDADWVQRASQTKAMVSQDLSFNIARGYTGEDRTAVITLRSGSAIQKIVIHQFPINDPIQFACPAVKDRLVLLFDADGDGELSYEEAANVTSLKNVFNEEMNGVVTPYVNRNEFISFDELQYFSGLTEIASYSFYDFPFLSSIVIPEEIKRIGAYAFAARQVLFSQEVQYNGSGLLSISLPESLEVIENNAFSRCPLSDGIVFPRSLKEIGDYAFSSCYLADRDRHDPNNGYLAADGLNSIKIPDCDIAIGYGAFADCKALTVIDIPNTAITSDPGNDSRYPVFKGCTQIAELKGSAVGSDSRSLVDKNGFLYYFMGNDLVEYVIPDRVTASIPICPETLKCLTVPSTYSFQSSDGTWYNPFAGYHNIEVFHGKGASLDGTAIISGDVFVAIIPTKTGSFTTQEGITQIAQGAFLGSRLNEIVIGNVVQKIGDAAFCSCHELSMCTLPKGYKTIERWMFEDCPNLDEIRNIESVTAIEYGGLKNCDRLLARFKVPSSVKQIGALSLSSNSNSIIEFESLIPPTIIKDEHASNLSPFGSHAMIYVPDIAYDRYRSSYYGFWGPVHKSSELYEPVQFDIQQTDYEIAIRVKGDENPNHIYSMVRVEAGSFNREVPSSRRYKSNNEYEYDCVDVNVTNDYYIGRTEFPQWLWTRIMHSNPSTFTDQSSSYPLFDSEYRPVETISWLDCINFISELNKLSGLNFRLPTEAEWEFAAKGGKYSMGYLFSGSNNPEDVAVFNQNYTSPCGSRYSNELGLYDMNGNVWEYCQDYYSDWRKMQALDIPQGDNPQGPSSGDARVIRGGYYRANFKFNGFSADMSTNRNMIQEKPNYGNDSSIGFRLAL